MSTAKPFSWVVRFTVAPLWIQDGFSISDERAHSMLSSEVGYAHGFELGAEVLEAPSPLQIVRMQGYAKEDASGGVVVRELMEGAPRSGLLWNALIAARNLLDSVAFVAKEGDTEPVLAKIAEALAAINARQGERVEIEA